MKYFHVSASLWDGAVSSVGRRRHLWPVAHHLGQSFPSADPCGCGRPNDPFFSSGKHVLYVYTPSPSRCRIPHLVVSISAFKRKFSHDVHRLPGTSFLLVPYREYAELSARPVADSLAGSARVRSLVRCSSFHFFLSQGFATGLSSIHSSPACLLSLTFLYG